LEREYEIRRYHSDDEEEIVQLLNLSFKGWPKFDLNCSPLEHWRWKYQDNPLKMNFITVGTSQNKIIGCDHGTPLKIKIGDRVLLGDYSADTAVHPNFRGMGVAKNMIEQSNRIRKKAGVKFFYWVTNNPRFIEIYSKIRPRFPHLLTILVRIRDVDLQLREIPVDNPWLIKLGFHAMKLKNDVDNFFNRPRPSNREVHITEVKSFDNRIEEFWSEVSNHYQLIIDRSRRYLNWRFCDPRSGDFIIRYAEDGDERVLGYSILRVNRYLGNYPVGYIVDLLTLHDHLDVADALVENALNYFNGQKCNLVSCLAVKNHPFESVFKRRGFIDSKISPHVFYNPLGIDDDLKNTSLNKVYFSYGDIDSLPVSTSREHE